MLSILYFLFIVISASSPLWILILLLIIGAKTSNSPDITVETDDKTYDVYISDKDFPVAAVCD